VWFGFVGSGVVVVAAAPPRTDLLAEGGLRILRGKHRRDGMSWVTLGLGLGGLCHVRYCALRKGVGVDRYKSLMVPRMGY